MEWVKGESLKDTLWKNCFSKSSLQKYIRETSCWLKQYHLHAGLDLQVVDTTLYLSNLKSHIELSNAEDLLNKNSVFQSGFQALSNFESLFVGFKTNHTDLHGDLNLSNFIVGDDFITGIDIGGIDRLPIENDLAQLLNYICVNYFNMLTRFDIKQPQDTWEIF